MLVCEAKDFTAALGNPNSVPSHVFQSGSSAADTSQNDISKRGKCWFELKRSGMLQWTDFQQVESYDQQGESSPRFSSTVIKEENLDIDDVKVEFDIRESHKRKCGGKKFGKPKAARKNAIGCKNKSMKQNNLIMRWSMHRYEVAEKRLFEILKNEGASFGKPISRPDLRMIARKCIGDTGLLDHLLKDIDGKIAPGGSERFRRCYDTSGVMQYWVEAADLDHEQKNASIAISLCNRSFMDSASAGELKLLKEEVASIKRSFLDSASARELRLLKEEVADIKRNLQHTSAKHQEPGQANSTEGLNNELLKWKAKTERSLKEISSSLSGMKETCEVILTWKMKVEQQLLEISGSLCNLQGSKQGISSSPAAERWEDWLEGTNLQNMQAEDFAPWLEKTNHVQFGQVALVQDPCFATPAWTKPCDTVSPGSLYALQVEGVRPNTVNMDRCIQEVVPRSQWDDQTIVTPDSSVTANSNLDFDGAPFQFQELYKDYMNWKVKVERQLTEISGALAAMQAASRSRN